MTLQYNMTFTSKNRHESEQERLEELTMKALRTRPNPVNIHCHNPHTIWFFPISYVFQQTNSQIPSFLLSLGNKDLAAYQLHRTKSCMQMAAQTVRKWVSCTLSSSEGCFAHCSTENSGECISYRVRGGRWWTQVNKGSTTDPFLVPTIFSRDDESTG